MSASPRVLFVAAPDAAVGALDAVRQGGPVEGRLAPTSDILRSTLAKGADAWDAVVFVPGGPVDDVEVAAYVPESIPLVVVADEVPLLMAGSGAKALPLHELAYLATALAAKSSESAPSNDEPVEAEAPGEDAPEPFEHDQLATLADHLPVGLYRSSPEGQIIYANPALATLLGAPSVEALISASAEDALGYPRDAFLDAIRETGSVQNLVLSWTRRSGERIHTRESARAVRDEAGVVLYYEGTIEDVTSEVEALRDLRDAEASLSVVAEHAPHVLYRLRYTPNGSSFDFLSPAIEALTGYSRDEIEARGGLTSLVYRRDVLEGHGLTEGPIEGVSQYLAVYRMKTAHGERWVENTGRQWCSADGHVLGLVGVLQDVTERKEREDQLADDAQAALIRQRALVDLAQLEGADSFGAPAAAIAAATLGADSVSLWRTTKQGSLKALHAPAGLDDAAAIRALEVALSTVASQRALAITDLEDERIDELGLRPFARAYGLESLLIAPIRRGHRVGGVVVVHHVAPHDWDAAEAEFAAAAADAVALGIERSERTRAVAALHDSERRHRVLAEMASDYAFATRERDGRTESVVWTAGACARLTGEEISGPAGVQRLRGIIPDSSESVVRALADGWRENGEADAEVEILSTNGDRCWVHHRALIGETNPDGSVVVYHSGRDVTLQKRHESELIEARKAAEEGQAEAERMHRLKSGFLANMSHEIRTPLTGILGFADLLESELEGDHQEFVGHIARNGNRLLRTLSDVLDLSRLDAGEFGADLRPATLGPILRRATQSHALEADAQGLRFDLELDPAVGASVDPVVLEHAIRHVVDNAIKFTDSGGVLVALDSTENDAGALEAVIRVADTGCGISEAFLDDLFDAFRQQDTGYARSHEGSGLGLTLTKRLVDLLEGRVEVESEQPGGTTVTISLPAVEVATPDATQPEPVAPEPVHVEDDQTLPLDPLPAETHEPSLADLEDYEPAWWSAPDSLEAPIANAALEGPAADAETPAPSTPDADTLGDPFDFAFLADPSPDPALTAPVSPTADMFSFRRTKPDPEATEAPAPQAAPSPPAMAPDAPPHAPARPAAPAAPAPVVPTRPAAPAPVAPVPIATPGVSAPAAPMPSAPSAPTQPAPAAPPQPAREEPVFLVRNRADSGPTIPEVTVTEDAEIVEEASEVDTRPSVLVVEDNDDTRMLLERILRSTYVVTAVADARSALQAMNQQRFGGLVLDINLGGKETGADVLRIARALPDYGSVFAIALTAYALPGDRERLLEAGFNEYVSKPFTRQALMETLAAGVAA